MDQKWNRHRFKTTSADDPRPVTFPPPGPWWCCGYAGDDSYAIVVCYLPPGEDVRTYWPEAFDIDTEGREEIVFTSRFPRPTGGKTRGGSLVTERGLCGSCRSS